ncbi:uncharacterized protein UDID_19648 [Ustilago sp. UG-2017a]|nr:uncharacterized protein UDID_19648 [Ustilago sp. UG-2017a]
MVTIRHKDTASPQLPSGDDFRLSLQASADVICRALAGVTLCLFLVLVWYLPSNLSWLASLSSIQSELDKLNGHLEKSAVTLRLGLVYNLYAGVALLALVLGSPSSEPLWRLILRHLTTPILQYVAFRSIAALLALWSDAPADTLSMALVHVACSSFRFIAWIDLLLLNLILVQMPVDLVGDSQDLGW